MDSGWIFVGVAFSLVWLTLAGYMFYLASRSRRAAEAWRAQPFPVESVDATPESN